jgi:hypothetical protein
MNDLALHSDAAPVHYPDQAEFPLQGLVKVFFDDACHIARLERVQIYPVFDRDFHRFAHRIESRHASLSGQNSRLSWKPYRFGRRTAIVLGALSASPSDRVATACAAWGTPFSCAMRA